MKQRLTSVATASADRRVKFSFRPLRIIGINIQYAVRASSAASSAIGLQSRRGTLSTPIASFMDVIFDALYSDRGTCSRGQRRYSAASLGTGSRFPSVRVGVYSKSRALACTPRHDIQTSTIDSKCFHLAEMQTDSNTHAFTAIPASSPGIVVAASTSLPTQACLVARASFSGRSPMSSYPHSSAGYPVGYALKLMQRATTATEVIAPR